ncbi:DUF1269 domain-containing protein [Granulosicoccus antarcticus]|uniref:DUF1269 domain-containing protein n=1 Tax=Granulosicoccus antarcticus IMCC3135 TaxID=1192854 RepID=A0A2Z2P6Q1_9GAMM|nr:DUF1269 domain-containing protein [Granulosicoccus antarcticus]ASJ75534.1 hypothetical protein IMCC3135_27400 [Granulosicoccus antarcticus IMCC3135]
MKKIIFSVPDKPTGIGIIELLKAQGLDESHISVLGNESTEFSAMPEAGEFENDVVPASKRGVLVGGATGLLAGLGAALVLPGVVIGGAALAAALALSTAGGATFGVLASTLIGASVPHSQIREYEAVIERGELLMIIEVDDEQAAEVTAQVQSHDPSVSLMGEIDAVPPIV